MIFSRQLLMNKCEIAEGYPLVFSSNRDKQARDWSITGTSIGDIGEDGKYHLNVVNSGKSLMSATDYFSKAPDYTVVTEDGLNCVKFQNGISYNYTDIEFKPNTQYTVSLDAKSVLREGQSDGTGAASCIFRFVYTDGTYSNLLIVNGTGWTKRTLTSTAGKTVDYIRAAALEYRYWIYVDIDTFQLEEGTTATEYEQYRESTVTEVTFDDPIGVVKSEKNLFNKDAYSAADGYYNNNGVYTASSNGLTCHTANYTEVKPSTQYYVGNTGCYDGSTAAIYYYDINKEWIKRETWTVISISTYTGHAITTPDNCYYVRFQLFIDSTSSVESGQISFNPDTFQFEEGAVATEYEPYYIPTEGTAMYKNGALPALEVCEGTNVITVEGYEPSSNIFNVDEFVKLVKAKDSTATVETIDGRNCLKFYNRNVYGIDLSTVCIFDELSEYTLSADFKNISTVSTSGTGGLYFGYVYDGATIYNFTNTPSSIGNNYRTMILTKNNCADWTHQTLTSKSHINITTLAMSYGDNAYWAIDLDTIQLTKSATEETYKPYCKVRNMTIKY